MAHVYFILSVVKKFVMGNLEIETVLRRIESDRDVDCLMTKTIFGMSVMILIVRGYETANDSPLIQYTFF